MTVIGFLGSRAGRWALAALALAALVLWLRQDAADDARDEVRETMRRFPRRMRRLLAMLSVCAATGCSGISPPGSVAGASRAFGDALPGARGLTLADQDRIDETVARGCAIGAFAAAACDRHTAVSFARRRALRDARCGPRQAGVDALQAQGLAMADQAARGAILRELWVDAAAGAWALTERDDAGLCVLQAGRGDLGGRRLADFD